MEFLLEETTQRQFVAETADAVKILVDADNDDLADVIRLRGEKGEQGETGPTGAPGANFLHTQSIAADAWVVNHNLGYVPNVTVLSVGGRKMEAEVLNNSVNQLTVYFDSPLTGQVVCS